MNLSEGFRVGITAIVIITMTMVEAPIITTLSGHSLFIAGTLWVLMIIGSYCIGRVLSELHLFYRLLIRLLWLR